MSSDYFKVLKHLKIETDIVGRGKESAFNFEKENNTTVISRDLNDYINSTRINSIDSAIVSVNIENLYDVCNKLLDTDIKHILLEKPGFLYENEICNLEKNQNL